MFNYEREELDALGHVVYVCKCARCGYEVIYARKTNTEPLCQVCYNKKVNSRKRSNYRRKPVRDLVKAIRGYYECYDSMPNMKVVEELAESVINDE